jgi:UDPglucose 6-dehydrogenase
MRMEIAVAGLWHLGTVTAACLAAAGWRVRAFDQNADTVRGLQYGRLPVAEPGLSELTARGALAGLLSFSNDPVSVAADILWVTYDTPVDAQDRADAAAVLRNIEELFQHLKRGALVIISSQLPVGATARLEAMYCAAYPDGNVSFSCVPENLRLGNAIEVFTRPDRVVAGVRTEADRAKIASLLAPFTDRIEWMSVESAEMTKHALNAFLATSVVFINEVAAVCEQVGADVREVERGLKSDVRIGQRAYLKAGAAFAGGTLARDVTALAAAAETCALPLRLLPAVHESNNLHKNWPCRRLDELLAPLAGKRIGVLGLTYKPGTDTLRRSSSLEACRWLASQGALVRAYDPAVAHMPAGAVDVQVCASARNALLGADAVLVATPWPVFRELSADNLADWAKPAVLVVDAAAFLAERLERDQRIRYVTVGRAA